MSNPDILGRADKILRPVLKELHRFPWLRVEGCCAGHKQEDSLWMEIRVLGSSGLSRLSELLRILDSKLAGTDIRLDCLLIYRAGGPEEPVPHGWDLLDRRGLLAIPSGMAPQPVDDHRIDTFID